MQTTKDLKSLTEQFKTVLAFNGISYDTYIKQFAPTPQPPKQPKCFTKKYVAELLDISIRQLDRLHDNGLIDYVRTGRRSIRIPSASLEQFINNGGGCPEKMAKNTP